MSAPLARLVSALRRGEPVIYPTESSYALGCLPGRADAVARLCRRKGRPVGQALPLIAADWASAHAACHIDAPLAAIARALWPGPVALVVPLRRPSAWPRGLAAADGTVAVRQSPHPFALAVAHAAGGLVVATSANAHGAPPWRSPAPRRGFAARLSALWAGSLAGGPPSTLVAIRGGQLACLRQGAVPWARVAAAAAGG